MNCANCPRNCNIDRKNKNGFCGVSDELTLAKACLHYWEEPIISGEKGSGTIFFSGCTLKCVFCQNYEVSRGFGKTITVDRLCDIMKELESEGANNINLVTPTQFVDQIMRALDKYKPRVPIVYNTSGYEKVETIKKLNGYVDIYLPDLKYSDNSLAQKYSKAPNYFETATAAILEMKSQVKDVIENDLMRSGVIIRHLLLPGALNNTFGVIDWLKDNVSQDSYVSLMGQFIPYGESKKFEELNRKIKPIEYKIAINRLIEYNFKNAFIQELTSASDEYVPNFNLQGV